MKWVQKQIDGQDHKQLTLMGKEVLIKIVACALPDYTIQYFVFPLILCKKLEKCCHNFLWGSIDEKRNIY